ncbi:hypothetical protein RRF57_005986 [Xylaria bambusicola]|uniref:Uncharacterized protein n=1 Tax=Xylaria bambusicola TaxID=326684 RepID=A0AAN7Z584_9PEZI
MTKNVFRLKQCLGSNILLVQYLEMGMQLTIWATVVPIHHPMTKLAVMNNWYLSADFAWKMR